nr:unnamed protein product [Digitaria exilis]
MGGSRTKPRETVIIELDDDEEEEEDGGGGGGGGGQAGRRALGEGAAAIAGGGEPLRPVKPEPVEDVRLNAAGPRAPQGFAVVPIPPRKENPRALPPVAAVRPASRPRPEVIDISDEDDEDSAFRGVLPLRMIDGSGGRGVRPIKDEPFLESSSDWARSAEAERSLVPVLPPGSISAERKRKREGTSTSRGKPDARGDSQSLNRNSSASGAGPGTMEMADKARSSRKGNNVKNKEASRGSASDRSLLAKKAFAPSEESRGPQVKARRGGRARSGERSSTAAPASWVGTTVGSRVRSRSRQQSRVQHATYSARVSSEDTEEGDDEEVEQDQEQKTGEDVKVMEVDDYDDSGNEVAQERDQEETVEEIGQDGHGDSEDEYREGRDSAAVADNDEEIGEKELLVEEDEYGNQEDSHSIYDDEEEEEEEDGESEDNGQELGETGEVQPFTTSNATAGGSVLSGCDGKRVFRWKIFEGIYLPENPRQTDGKGVHGRTRSKRKCKDKKLLRRGTFSKPYNIDVSDSTSDSEEDIPPAPPPGPMSWSSSDDNTRIFGKRKRRRRNKRRGKRLSTSSDESEEYRAHARDAGGPYRRLKKGLSSPQICKDGSNLGRAKYNGPNGGNPMDMGNAQDDISFKRKTRMIRVKKRGRIAKAAYDELLNSLFAGWENHVDVPGHAETGNSLPLVFSFGDEDEPCEKTENDKYHEDLWRECDIAFESINIGSHGCEEDGQEVPQVEQTSCKNGKHEFIIDEQVGVRCKHCHIVDLEIRHVLPTMGKFSAERESAVEPELDSMLKEMLDLFEENDVLVSNGHEVPCSFGGHKAGSVWDLIPGVKENMFPHQQDAFEFIWTKLAGGKTRLAITFVQAYLEVFPQCSPVIIAPRGMLATWEKEFKKWKKEVIASMEKTIAMGLEAEYKISLASIHPSLVASAKLSEKEESIVDRPKLESLRSNPSEGVKTKFVLEIVSLCEVLNERVLVFSQYLEPLSLIMEQLKARFSWAEGKEILLMSGNVLVKNRQTMMEAFNNMKSKAKVMLASTKACCEGITLTGASRVVLLDVVWNPSVGRQAIGRAYRIGQEKIVYTYNLIAEGTAEKSKYDRQAEKEEMSKLLFSKEPDHGGCNLPSEGTINDRILEEMTAREDLKNLFVKIV